MYMGAIDAVNNFEVTSGADAKQGLVSGRARKEMKRTSSSLSGRFASLLRKDERQHVRMR